MQKILNKLNFFESKLKNTRRIKSNLTEIPATNYGSLKTHPITKLQSNETTKDYKTGN